MFPTGQTEEKFKKTHRVVSLFGLISTFTLLVLATSSKLPITELLLQPAAVGLLLLIAFMPHHFMIWRLNDQVGELKRELSEIKERLGNG